MAIHFLNFVLHSFFTSSRILSAKLSMGEARYSEFAPRCILVIDTWHQHKDTDTKHKPINA